MWISGYSFLNLMGYISTIEVICIVLKTRKIKKNISREWSEFTI